MNCACKRGILCALTGNEQVNDFGLSVNVGTKTCWLRCYVFVTDRAKACNTQKQAHTQ